MQNSECISIQTNAETKEFLRVAAILSGHNDISDFVLNVACVQAENILKDNQKRVLSDRDRDLVLDLINNPPEPNEKLVELFRRHNKGSSDL